MATFIEFKDQKMLNFLKDLNIKVNTVKGGSKLYAGALQGTVFGDVIDHFNKEQGPEGRWSDWSGPYEEIMKKKGKGGNLILTDTGKLRSGWQPGNFKRAAGGIMFFNKVPYAKTHDEGSVSRNIPKRQFTWISDTALEKMTQITLAFLLKDI